MEWMYGPTKPLEVPRPQDHDYDESEMLYGVLAECPSISPNPVLTLVESMALRIVQRHSQNTQEQWARAYPFGSCGLSASVAESDLDVALICPSVLTTDIFFDEFPRLLYNSVGPVSVVAARVPVVKFEYRGTAVDVVFVSVGLPQPPTEEQMLDDSFLLKVARETRPSANGIRFTFEIKRRLPVPYDVFTAVLKTVKLWAMRRMVYGNVYTYPNGAVLAIMVARVCQVLPSSHPSTLLRFFFLFYTQWMSRHDRISPVYLTATLEGRGRIPGLPDSWKPSKDKICCDLFPVISPAYPYVNDASSVGRCGLEALYSEITRVQCILTEARTLPLEEMWEPYRIEEEYSTFLVVGVSCAGHSMAETEQALSVWSSYVASRLRILIYSIERHAQARPCPRKIRPKKDNHVGGSSCFLSVNFLIGVKAKEGGPTPQPSLFTEACGEFHHAVKEGCNNDSIPWSFQRNDRAMHWPRVKFLEVHQVLHLLQDLK
ncbi:poly(A) polymerase [Trypanosoma brucei brucei TREU927]|uniref:polynucleotide adenylyltransferase n=1 Tax=Trypanosoma brucei brucei (strain 927/4 GUTat10.1) TaxID=185431 RepID=Q57ZJ6_TRYB2|nr:poly(A) polymerase [Trypanosoma brucei brucei TREU927]AAX79486.1 poly(A) polymerase [Trypanosoma brucei]AAZ10350.1 poly(A) polymerase [Trypanosoma brucei brucei TREU927]